MKETVYFVKIKVLDRGMLVTVDLENNGPAQIGEGYCGKRSEVPQCIKDIFTKEMSK